MPDRTEVPLTLPEAQKLPKIQVNGRSPAISTLRRWASPGIRGVCLRMWKVGGTTCTSKEAVDEFLAALNTASVNPASLAQAEAVHALA